uniref:Transposon Ty3-G Gag-Pol polyprotein n=1 Tax=Cajanus cajan TaxID=3821 RepID=A0A151QQ90_CAJCA|nr:Transposon Ty3-G Gag-Pol polyprotein [Cajanus cajan]
MYKEITEEPKRIHSVSQHSAIDLDPRIDQDERVEPIEDKHPLRVGASNSQLTYHGTVLSEQEKSAIGQVVLDNRDLFAWHPSDMPGIDPDFLCHKLSISKEANSTAQRCRKAGEERKAAIEVEVSKLLEARFIREVHYTTWLANVVMVRKPNGKWRMCTDYTNLNKACPKDAYPSPNIDRLVDGASGHKFLSFLDAYSGYNQIRMHPQDEEKMAFITETANYCYRVMSFGLKNAGATYQRLMNKIFHDQIGRSMEVYVDDMVVKSSDVSTHVRDLAKVFQALRQHQMRLNPEKCVFGVSGGKFLGFIWTRECEESFQQFKERLSAPPILSKPVSNLDMIVYLAVSSYSVSVVLVQENQGNQQPMHFISRTFVTAECMAINEDAPSWITPIRKYIVNGELLADPVEARNLRTQVAWYSVVANELYRRGFSTPLLKCIDNHQADYVLQEIQEGICGSHSGGRTMAAKVLRAGYYWPTLKGDCAEFVKKCVQCQKHGNLIHASAAELHNISSPFSKKSVGRGTARSPLGISVHTTKETPFRLTYGADAMIPVKVGEPSFRQLHFHEESNGNSLRAELDVLDEAREKAQVVAEACKQRMS